GDIGKGPQNLLNLKITQIDSGHSVIGVVAHEKPTTIIVTIGFADRRMVRIAPREASQHVFRLLVEAVACSWVGSENRDCRDMPHGRNSGNVDVSRMPSRIEEIILVDIA